jgi:hypothetical protein
MSQLDQIRTKLSKAFNRATLGIALATLAPATVAEFALMNNAAAADPAIEQVDTTAAAKPALPVASLKSGLQNIIDAITPQNVFAGAPPAQPVVHTYILRPVAISAFDALFGTDDEKTRNVFFKETRQAVSEYKVLTNAKEITGALTADEVKAIREIRREAQPDVKKYKISLGTAETLRFAADQTGIDHEAFMNRLSQSAGNLAAANPAGLIKTDVFKFNVSTWLYLVKNYGAQHGLGYFSGKIKTETAADGRTLVSVNDAALLRQIADMRHNPRISALMGAEYIKNESGLPTISYKGITYSPNPVIAQRQTALMTLGFDLGIRGADGSRGPLTDAAMAEFLEISRPLLQQGQKFDAILTEAARQAAADSAAYSTDDRPLTTANAFAIRHASRIVGTEFGYMMELAQAESNFDETAEATTSSATGLFQFTDQSWLMMLSLAGAKYGLNDLTSQIAVSKDKDGNNVYKIENPLIANYALSLRNDPRICALMGAEFAKTNKDDLKAALPRTDITRTDQYLAHFLGSGSAVSFITHMERSPNRSGSALFHAAARSNKTIFYTQGGRGKPRSLKQIYAIFSRKFDTGVYDAPPVPTPRPRPANLGKPNGP